MSRLVSVAVAVRATSANARASAGAITRTTNFGRMAGLQGGHPAERFGGEPCRAWTYREVCHSGSGRSTTNMARRGVSGWRGAGRRVGSAGARRPGRRAEHRLGGRPRPGLLGPQLLARAQDVLDDLVEVRLFLE